LAEFSLDGNLVLCWWLPEPPVGDYTKMLGKCVVFDLRGNRLREASDERGLLTSKYELMFPTTAAREHFAWFLRDTNEAKVTLWGFPADYSVGFRLLKAEGDFSPATAELWRLAPATARLWSVPSPSHLASDGLAGFLKGGGATNILLAPWGLHAYVLSATDGKVLETFYYGKPETEADQDAFRRRFGITAELDDPSLSFFARALSFDQVGGLMACGASDDRRVRILTVAAPHRVVFEAHASDSPRRPSGGTWSVVSVSFDAGGRYLAAAYEFAGRLTTKRITIGEVFDTRSWQVVWSAEGRGRSTVRPPRISPNGDAMALVKDNWLEIRPFPSQ
jgi:hypothetical protein